MKLDWNTVTRDHAAKACELISQNIGEVQKEKGLFVVFRGRRLPAKNVARLAYCLAHGLPLDASINFASGEGTLKRLQELGLEVGRA